MTINPIQMMLAFLIEGIKSTGQIQLARINGPESTGQIDERNTAAKKAISTAI